MNIPKALIVAAGFVLILKPPAFAQSSADPYDTWAAASSAQDEGQTSQTSLNTDDNQALTETDWWAENDGLTFGYLPGGYGFGLATCGAGSRSTGRGSVWWNAAGTSAWFPAGQQLPYPYGSGWCGNNAYGNLSGYAPWINQVIASPGRHRHLVGKRRTGGETNRQTLSQAAASKAPWAMDSKREGPDDDWTRVEDHVESPPVQQPRPCRGSVIKGFVCNHTNVLPDHRGCSRRMRQGRKASRTRISCKSGYPGQGV